MKRITWITESLLIKSQLEATKQNKSMKSASLSEDFGKKIRLSDILKSFTLGGLLYFSYLMPFLGLVFIYAIYNNPIDVQGLTQIFLVKIIVLSFVFY